MTIGEMRPKIIPSRVPSKVDKPVMVVMRIVLVFLTFPKQRGMATQSPSAILCKPIVTAVMIPIWWETSLEAPIAIPSGRLCRAIPKAIKYPILAYAEHSGVWDLWTWGIEISITKRNIAPTMKPAMHTKVLPMSRLEGIRPKVEIPIIIPEAKPRETDNTFLVILPNKTDITAPRPVAIPARNP